MCLLGYMRHSYRHFNHASLPGWCEGDALLAERIDGLVAVTRQLQQGGEEALEMRALAEPFSTA